MPATASPAGSGGTRSTCTAASSDAVEVDLIECPELYDRPQIYGADDDGDRFALLARAGLAIAEDWGADIVHAHDWHGALAPILAQGQTTVLTIHNLAYQGHQPPAFAVRHGLPRAAGAGRLRPRGRQPARPRHRHGDGRHHGQPHLRAGDLAAPSSATASRACSPRAASAAS